MEFVILRNAPDPDTACCAGQTYVLTPEEIRDSNGLVLGRIHCSCATGIGTPGTRTLWQAGQLVAEFRFDPETRVPTEFVYQERSLRLDLRSYYVCDELHARTVIPWFPQGQCHFQIDDTVDPVCALFLFHCIDRFETETDGG